MNPRTLTPSMSLLLAFEASARHESYTRAAEELSLTQSAVSRQVQALETLLDLQLFRRTGRQIALTDVGAMYMSEIGAAVGRIRNATLQVLAFRAGGGNLHLAVLPTFGAKWLMPRLHMFYSSHPNVLVHLHSRIGRFDLDLAGMDAAIGVGDDQWPGLVAHKMLEEELVPIVSPAFSEQHSLQVPLDLTKLLLLQVATRPTVWREWFAARQIPVRGLKLGPTFELTSHLIQAVMTGIGVGLVPRCLVEEELRAKTLRVAFDSVHRSGLSYYFTYPPHKSSMPALVAFRDWLLAMDKIQN